MQRVWRKSSRSQNDTACVVWSFDPDGSFYVGDDKDMSGPKLKFTKEEYEAFIWAANNGEVAPRA